jgi:CheY-like chemotaxis protein
MVSPEVTTTIEPEHIPQNINGKPVVLVVEDNPDNMITVKALLGTNYTIIEAINGKEGVEMAKKHQPNLVLMDIALPKMDGFEAFTSIRTLDSLHHIPIIALTASAMAQDRETILAYGFDAYITKPIDETIFYKTFEETLYAK